MKVEVRASGPGETERLGRVLAAFLEGGEWIGLVGALGSGKTTFVRGLAEGLGADPSVVRSPSYAIHHRYRGERRDLDHVDAYFVREAEEFDRMGVDEWLEAGHLVVVEWADRFASLLERADWRIDFFDEGPEARRILLTAPQRANALRALERTWREAGEAR